MTAQFTVWAPNASRLDLLLDGTPHAMRRDDHGWWSADPDVQAAPGARYGYSIDGGPVRPDPRTRRQPDGVHGESQVWTPPEPTRWSGTPLARAVIYELHVGTFTPQGTLDSAIDRLDALVDLGITHVELMPVAAFNGDCGWGYDGVQWWAVHEAYGGPDAYVRFVAACHERGLAVVQDVVYNHFGPSGNYVPEFGPWLHASDGPWGSEIDFTREPVRAHVRDNVRFWLRDMGVDALRLDAVHALRDPSPVHILEDLVIEVEGLRAEFGRELNLIAESDLNDPNVITPRADGGLGLDAQWDDDFHHAVHSALTGEVQGYYEDFGTLSALEKVLAFGFFHDGTYSSFRGRDHGAPVDRARTPAWRLVVSIQNHDQVGNRASGDRPSASLDESRLLLGAMLMLASGFTPMLFQGEEWAASTPFAFFTGHPEPDLADAVATGRISEFARMGWNLEDILNPQDPQTFSRSKLQWDERGEGRHARVLAGYRRLIELRRSVPAITNPDLRATSVVTDPQARHLTVTRDADGSRAVVFANLAADGDPVWCVDPGELELAFATSDDCRTTPAGLELPPGSGVLAITRRPGVPLFARGARPGPG